MHKKAFIELIEANGDAYWEFNPLNQTLFISQQMKTILGFENQPFELNLETWTQRVHPEDFAKASEKFVEMLEGKSDSYEANIRVKHKNGSYVWLLDRGRISMRNSKGDIELVSGTHINITKQKQTEDALNAANSKLQSTLNRMKKLLTATDDGYWEWDIAAQTVYFSPSWKAMLGYRDDELENAFSTWEALLHPEDGFAKKEAAKLASNPTYKFRAEFRLRTKDGSYKWILSRAKAVENDTSGNPYLIVGTHVDITESKKHQHTISDLQNKYTSVIESIPNVLFSCKLDKAWTMLFISNAIEKLTGYKASDFIANSVRSYESVIHPDDTDYVSHEILNAVSNDVPYEITYRIIDAEKRTVWVLEHGKRVLTDEGEATLEGIISDITQQKRYEAQLKESELRWKFALEGSGDGVWDWNLETDEVYFSSQWKKMLGFEPHEIENSLEEWRNRVHPHQLDAVYKDISAYLEGKTNVYKNEHQLRCKDGSYKWILDRGVVVERNIDGTPLRMIGTHSDINEEKQLRSKMQRLSNRFISMFQSHEAVMLLVSPDTGAIVDANISASHFYGYTHTDLIHMNISEINMLNSDAIKSVRKKALHHTQNKFLFQHRLSSGEIRTVEVHSSPIQTDNGNLLFSIIFDVTQEKENETKLKRALEQLSQAKKLAKLGVWELDLITDTLQWSDEIYEIFELDKARFTPSYDTFVELIHPADRRSVAQAYESSLHSKENYEISHRLLLPNGRIKHVQEQCDTVFDENGKPLRSIGTVYDVTTLENQKERYALLLNAASDGIHIMDIHGNIIEASDTFVDMLGYTMDEMKHLNVRDWDRAVPVEQLEEVIQNLIHTPKVFETRHQRKNGEIFDVQINAKGIVINDTAYLYASARDITEQKKLEHEIIEERNFVSTIIDTANAIVAVIQPDGTMSRINKYAQEFTGYTQEEVASQPYFWDRFLNATVRGNVKQIIAKAAKGEIVRHFQNSWISKEDEEKMFEWSNQLVQKKDGSMDYIFTIGIDIQDKVEAQQQLITQKEEFETIFKTSKDGLAILDLQSNFLKFNDSYLQMTGFSSDELLQQSCIGLSVPEDVMRAKKAIEEVIQKGFVTNFEKSCFKKDGSILTVNTSISLLPDKEQLLISAKDISQEKIDRMEKEHLLTEQKSLLSLFDKGDSVLFKWNNDAHWSVAYVSENASNLLGYSYDAFIHDKVTYASLIHKEDLAHVFEEVTEAKEKRLDFFKHDPYRVIDEAGNEHWVLDYTVVQKNSQGDITHFIGYITDITEQMLQQKSTARNLLKLKLATEVANVGVWTWNIENNTLEWDDQMYAIYEKEKHHSTNPLELWQNSLHPEDAQSTLDEARYAVEHAQKFEGEFRIFTASGMKYIKASANCLLDESGKATAMIGINSDITRDKAYTASLKKAKDDADKANQAKSSFLANMSHEIRTPLNGIIGLTDIVLRSDLDSEQKNYLQKAQQSSHALLHVINDILDYSKIEAGKLDIVCDTFELDTLLSTLSDLFSFNIQEKGLLFHFRIDPAIPNSLEGDALRITQVLNNLVGNAVKFTQEGFITLELKLLKRTESEVQIAVSVKDSGIGISESNLEKLFIAFSQADSSTTKNFGGTGLGLMITKQLVELMGGTISVESIEGEGTTFTFTLSLKYTQDEEQHIKPLLLHKEVLIADDCLLDREYLTALFTSWGAIVDSACDGKEALHLIAEHRYDYILLDWKMPKLDGLEVMESLNKQHIDTSKILMVSAHNKHMLDSQAKEKGMEISGLLEKPYTPSSLYHALFNHKGIDLESNSEHRHLTERKHSLVAEDNKTNQMVASLTLKDLGFEVTIANNGKEAVALAKETPFDIIFMDLQMPVMDGFSATRAIREFDTTTPIIALSAAVMKEDKEMTKEAGMNDHLAKPIDRVALETLVGHYFNTVEVADSPTLHSNSKESFIIEGADFDSFRHAMGIDTQMAKRMYNDFYQSYKTEPERLYTLFKSDKEAFKAGVHKLKGASGNLRITSVYEQSLNVESDHEDEHNVLLLLQALETVCADIAFKISALITHAQNSALDTKEVLALVENIIDKLNAMDFISSDEIETLFANVSPIVGEERCEAMRKLYNNYNEEELLLLLKQTQEEIMHARA